MERARPPGNARDEAVALGALIALLAITAAWWALALWPVQDSPEWLVRTRHACFGISASGLPDAGGWIGLIGGPLGMLAMLVLGWGREVRALTRRARTSRAVALTLGGLVLGTILLLSGAGLRVRQAHAATAGTSAADGVPPDSYPRLDRAAPPLALTAHDGRTRTLDDLRGRPVLVTFAYAHCETVCPVIVREVLAAQAQLNGEAAVLVVTLDPWRDTPARLPDMARSWQVSAPDAWILGGTVEAVETVLDAWEVPRQRNERTGAVTHPSLVYVIDDDGRIAYAATGGVEALVSLVRRLN